MLLAIGIVVDDAIVVVEAVYAKLEAGAQSAKEASISAMSEISSAIISITLVMAAVFVPITFIKGPAGVFYEQFGVTLDRCDNNISCKCFNAESGFMCTFLKTDNL